MSGARSWKSLTFPQKVVYTSAILNFGVLSFVWVAR